MCKSFRFGLFALSALLLAAGCSSGVRGTPPPGELPAWPAVERGPFESSLLLTGELEAVRSIEIKSPQTALFQLRILFLAEEGSTVAAGDPLIGFDDSSLADRVRELESQILNAEIAILNAENSSASQIKDLEIELAERRFDRDQAALLAGVDAEVLSRKEYSERQLALSKAEESLVETEERLALTRSRGATELEVLRIDRQKKQKDLRTARRDLDVLSIEAPAPGLVVYASRQRSTTKYQEGDSCWPGQVVMNLPDLSEMKVVFSVNEVDAPRLEVGMPVEIGLDAFPGSRLDGTITHIPSMAVRRDEDSKIAIFRVEATLAAGSGSGMRLKPGMSARGRIVIESFEDVPLVRRDAVTSDEQGYRLAGASFEPLSRNASHYRVSEEDWEALR